ncbi:lipase family protein [Brytella acorum]|uniref:Secretory lipase n=1 Tax=Brytella acorum TaxID=2959299 RepID=A0AA35XX33_9PROT|nr:lipase family protein [Brytella acorum]MDF3623712.1 lipase family protein [Brytella acorum]CAI9119870.1 hypothetical protein LMG32879_000696 [Brytella acorum]
MSWAIALAVGLTGTLGGCEAPQVDAPLSFRPQPGALISVIPKENDFPGRSAVVTYYTTDVLVPAHMLTVTAMVFTPAGPPPVGGWPVMAWGDGMPGLADDCAPTATDVSRGPYGPYLLSWLKRGFAVIMTDQPRRGRPFYLNAREEGMSMLDAVRAVTTNDGRFSRRTVLAGHGPGAHAALSAAGMVAEYAPELRIGAVVVSGAPYWDSRSVAMLAGQVRGESGHQRDPELGELMLMGASLAAAMPTGDAARAFSPQARTVYQQAGTLCPVPFMALLATSGLTPATALTASAFEDLKPAFDWAAYPTLRIQAPVFFAIGGKDVQVPGAAQDRLAADLCRAGTRMRVRHDPDQNHMSALFVSSDEGMTFAQNALRGVEPGSDCAAFR